MGWPGWWVAILPSCHRKPKRCPGSPDNSLLLLFGSRVIKLPDCGVGWGELNKAPGATLGTVDSRSPLLISPVSCPILNPLGAAKGPRAREA